MFCSNCGGEYADWALKCPYCGSVNDKGAEKKYMEHMEDLRKNLDQVDEESEADYKKTMSRSVKRISLIVLIIIAAAVVVFITVRVFNNQKNRIEETAKLQENDWEKEEYAKMDELYENGDFEGILTENEKLVSENSKYSLGDWEHYCFIFEFYWEYNDICQAKAQIEAGSGDSYTLGNGIYGALYLSKFATEEYIGQLQENFKQGYRGLSDEDVEMVRTYQQEAADFLSNSLKWSEDEINEVYEECTPDDYLTLSPCYDKGKELAKEYGWE